MSSNCVQDEFEEIEYSLNNENLNLLKHTVVENVTNQLRQSDIQSRFGVPTCVRRSKLDRYLILGTSIGAMFVYEMDPISRQLILKSILEHKDPITIGSITCIDITSNGDLIAAGHSSGSICIWQTEKERILKVIDDLFENEISTLGITESESSSIGRIIAADSRGSLMVFDLSKSWFRFTYTVEYEIELKRERIVDLKILYSPRPGVSLVAFISEHRLFMFDIFPRVPVPLTSNPILISQCTPDNGQQCLSVAWYTHHSKGSVEEKLVAVLYRMYIVVYRLRPNEENPSHYYLDEYRRIGIDRKCTVIEWVSYTTLVALADFGVMHLIDISHEDPTINQTTLSTNDVILSSGIECIQNEIVLLDIQPLGPSLSKITVLGWKERINTFVKEGKWMEGVNLGVNMYKRRGADFLQQASEDKTTQQIVTMLEKIMEQKLSEVMKDENCPNETIIFCMKSCMDLGRKEYVFSNIFNLLRIGRVEKYFECLEQLILNSFVEELPQSILLQYMDRISNRSSDLMIIDKSLSKLNIQHVEFEKLRPLCCRSESELFYTLCHSYDQLQREYLQPLIEMYASIALKRPEGRILDTLLDVIDRYSSGLTTVPGCSADAKKDVLDFFFFSNKWNPKDKLSQQLIELKKDNCFAQLVVLRPIQILDIFKKILCDESRTSPWDDEYNRQEVLDKARSTIENTLTKEAKVSFYEFYCELLAMDHVNQTSSDDFTRMVNDIAANISEDRESKETRQYKLIRTLEVRQKKGMLSTDLVPLQSVVRSHKLYTLARYIFSVTKKWKWYVDINYERLTNRTGPVSETEKEDMKSVVVQVINDVKKEEAAHSYILTEIDRDLNKAQERGDDAQFQRLRCLLAVYIHCAFKSCLTEKAAHKYANKLLQQDSFKLASELYRRRTKGFRPTLMLQRSGDSISPCRIDKISTSAIRDKLVLCVLEKETWEEEDPNIYFPQDKRRRTSSLARGTISHLEREPTKRVGRPMSETRSSNLGQHRVIDILDFDEILDSLL